MKILFAASEVAPYSKTGGLGDVAAALPRALADRGHEVAVVSPLYGSVDRRRWGLENTGRKIPGGGAIWEAAGPGGLRHYFVENQALFGREGIYGYDEGDYPDNAERFWFLSSSLFSLMESLGFLPDVLHLNDWQTAPAAWLATRRPERAPKTVLTIHNLGFQGLFPLVELPGGTSPGEGWMHHGNVSYLKAGIVFSDLVTTVSPSYAEEIRGTELGFGMEEPLRKKGENLVGILNGIDDREWDPATDPHLPFGFSADALVGKRACKERLQEELGLDRVPGAMLVGIVSRIAEQKGFDRIVEAIPSLMERGLQLAVLGSGSPALEREVAEASSRYPGRIGLHLGFDEGLAHRIYAGSDAFLMPSRYEPCGLSQMYALRYGSIPIVRATGGLRDTVEDGETGYLFEEDSAAALLGGVDRALSDFEEPKSWEAMMRRGMRKDFSWRASAEAYEAAYLRARGSASRP